MTNAELFKKVFGRYATEVWSLPETEFLDWLNEVVELRIGYRELTKNTIVDNEPTAEPKKGKWIPVSERLPEKVGKYLVTAWNDMLNKPFVTILRYGIPISGKRLDWHMSDRDGDFYYDGVIAWMELPEAYKGEEV